MVILSILLRNIISKSWDIIVKVFLYLIKNPILTAIIIILSFQFANLKMDHRLLKDEFSILSNNLVSLTNEYNDYKSVIEEAEKKDKLDALELEIQHKAQLIEIHEVYNEKMSKLNAINTNNIAIIERMREKGDLSRDEISKASTEAILNYTNSFNNLLRANNQLLIETGNRADKHAAEVISMRDKCMWQEDLDKFIEENSKERDK